MDQQVEQADSDARRQLGFWTATALVVANMIGAGVFTTSGFALADLGRRSWVLWAWGLGGLLALSGALSYGALGRRMPESGGEYYFLARVFHPRLGFLAGWTSLLAGFTAPIAVAALVLGSYLSPSSELVQNWIGTAVICAAVLLHGIRLRTGALVQNMAVGIKLLMLVALAVFGALRVPHVPEPVATASFDVGAFAVTLIWISFAYSGWNGAVYIAGEIRDPERLLPRALVFATAVVTLVYLAVNAVFLYSTETSALAGQANVAAVAAQALGGDALRRGVDVLISIALFTSVCAMVMAGPRVYARMAEDGLFPRIFTHRHGVPGAAVALQGALACGVLWFAELATLLGYVGFTLGLSAAATVLALLVLRRREGPARVPIPGHPIIPVLFIVCVLASSGFMAAREPGQAAVGLATVLTGWPVYEVLRRRCRTVSSTRSPEGPEIW